MKNHSSVLGTLSLLFVLWSVPSFATEVKEWTFLLFLNGHNNLDSFGDMNMNQMKQVGSSDQVNLVVQWASQRTSDTRRVYVKKGEFEVVESLPRVDMGNYQNLVEFARWGAEKYPAKKYFIAVWNHGAGWHRISAKGTPISASDISYDDNTGNKITTEQLGTAMAQIAGIIGHKVDLYGSDACLMAMAEVAAEMQDSVSFFVGSEEVEPGQGWPYTEITRRWVANPSVDGGQLGSLLSEEYLAAYSGGVYGRRAVTMSTLDLTKMPAFNESVARLGAHMAALPAADIAATLRIANETENYTYGDYKDVGDFVNRLQAAGGLNVNSALLADVEANLQSVVISNQVSSAFQNSHGLAIWIPSYKYEWNNYGQRYKGLKFDQATGWSNFLSRFF